MWYLATLLLPEDLTTEDLAEQIFQDTLKACKSIGVSLVGGHTEITNGLSRPIVVGQMLGEVDKERLVRADGARKGDVIVLTKGIAIEGTAVIAREREAEMLQILGEQTFRRCRNFMHQPGISVLKEALAASQYGSVHAMHDPTEGGLATALHEVARAAGVGLLVRAEAVPVFAETQAICNHYHLHPMGLIASGALLIILAANELENLLSRLQSEGIEAAEIGEVTEKSKGVKLLTADGLCDLPLYEQDELTRI